MLTEDTFKKIEELEAACQDTTDNIKKPSHYQGRHGMEAIDVAKNFSACPEHEEGFYWAMLLSIYYDIMLKMALKTSKKQGRTLIG
ncbi:phage protein [Streptococcus pyogenes]|nr:phage protein [Streptococcus pyogenes]